MALDSAEVILGCTARCPVKLGARKVIVCSRAVDQFHILYGEAQFGLAVIAVRFIDSQAHDIASG